MAQSQTAPNGNDADPKPEELIADEANYRAKITISTIGGSPERAKTEKKRVNVAQVFGIATGIKMVDNPMDDSKPFIAITGRFEAINMYTAETWRSGILYLPGGFHEMIVSMLDDLKEGKDSKYEKTDVQFALAIDAEPADNPAGYTYIAKNLLPISRADPLAMLRTQALKALPPPKKIEAAEKAT